MRPVMVGSLGRFLVGVAAFELGNAAATLLILRATDLLSPGHDTDDALKIALLLYTGYDVAATVVSIPGGHLVDRRGGPPVLPSEPSRSAPLSSASRSPARASHYSP